MIELGTSRWRATGVAATLWILAGFSSAQTQAARAARAPETAEDPTRLELADGTRVEWTRDTRGEGYSIRTADGRRSGWRRKDELVRLVHRRFDPLRGVPGPRLWPRSGRLRLIQLETQPLRAYDPSLAELGVEVVRFVPGQTLIAEVPEGSEDAVRDLAFVRWMGPFLAEDRLAPDLFDAIARGEASGPATYTVQVARRGLADKRAAAAAVRRLGGTVRPLTADGFLLHATLGAGALAEVAALDEVLWIERSAAPRTAGAPAPVDNVRIDGGADFLEQRTGFAGRGVRGEVFDEGLEYTHPDFRTVPPIPHGANWGQRTHGTRATGVVFGDGTTEPRARGLLPRGQAIFASWRRLRDRYVHTSELVQAPYRAVFQTNSWGNGPSPPGYPSLSLEMDDLVHRYDLLTCQAFGNTGTQHAFRQAWAKNVVTVGGILHRDTLTTADDAWDGRATMGPATDGRIKPDLCYWNDAILTTDAPTGHANFRGTSAATPSVAGHFGLFFQMWHAEAFGNVASGADVFESRPRSATARAFLLNTAEPYPFTSAADDLARTRQGFGRPDVERLHAMSGNVLVIDEWRSLENMERARYRVTVAEGQDSLRATLVYTDLPGTSAAAVHRVNDLTLRLVSPSGLEYWGNAGLADGNVSTPGGAPDALDTVEQVWLRAPEPGPWRVEVFATEVVQDASPATPAVDAAFALVVGRVRPPVTDLGNGRPSDLGRGSPLLEARGSFVAGSPWRFDLSGAPPGRRAVLVLGTRAEVDLPPHDPRRGLALTLDGAGRASVSGTFRAGTSAPFCARAWVRSRRGYEAASNILEVRPPEMPAD